jgi:hypothetical protein
MQSAAAVTGKPEIAARWLIAAGEYPAGVLMPVPIAVPPRLTTCSSSNAADTCRASCSSPVAKAENSAPSDIGTAS